MTYILIYHHHIHSILTALSLHSYYNITYHDGHGCNLEEYSRLPTGRRIDHLPTGGRVVATMAIIQEHNPSHNINQFTYENILSDTAWLSDCNWIYNKCKSVEQMLYNIKYHCLTFNAYLIFISSSDDDQCVSISYPYQALMKINLSIYHIHIKQ